MKFLNLRAELDYVTSKVEALSAAVQLLDTREILDAIKALADQVQTIADTQAAQGSTLAAIFAELSTPETGSFNFDTATITTTEGQPK